MLRKPVTVWALADGRPGHWNQVCGLVDALSRRVLVKDIAITAPTRLQSTLDLFSRRWREADKLPSPDFIIGAGHATHLPMLLARNSRGGRAIVLMKPTFPTSMFDLCLIPDVQARRSQMNVIATRGALNRMRPDPQRDPDLGMILVGGPSRHVLWDSQSVIDQIYAVCSQAGDMHWTITTSRRTPDRLLRGVREMGLLNVTVVDGRTTESGWLPSMLCKASAAWVSIDSVSMVYEALTAGCSVGLIDVLMKRDRGKLARNLNGLIERGDVSTLSQWRQSGSLQSPKVLFCEADRCADEIVARFLPPMASSNAA